MITPADLLAAFESPTGPFVPIAAHRRALGRGVLLVQGQRGSGKTTLVRALVERSGQPIYPVFGALPVTHPQVTFLAAPPEPESDVAHVRLGWLLAALGVLWPAVGAGLPAPGSTVDEAMASLMAADRALGARGQGVVLLYDEPGGPLGDLLGMWLTAGRPLAHIAARVFLRPETPVGGSDGEALRRATARLGWEAADLMRLVAARLDPVARDAVRAVCPVREGAWGALPEVPTEDQMVELGALLAGRAVGRGVHRAYTSRWLGSALVGRGGEVSPAVLLDTLREAARFRCDLPLADAEVPLDLPALEFGLATAARRATSELSDDLGLGDALWAVREVGTPITRSTAVELWGDALTDRLLHERVLRPTADLLDLAPLFRQGLGVHPSALAPAPPAREPAAPRPRRAPTTASEQVRDELVHALKIDLVGPDGPDHDYAEERLPTRPSSWYLTGFLVPYEAPADPTATEQTEMALGGGGDDDPPPDRASARRVPFPSSLGMSVLVTGDTEVLDAVVSWGDYRPEPPDAARPDEETWARTPRESAVGLLLRLSDPDLREEPREDVPGSDGLQLRWQVRAVQSGPARGARAVSVFLVNHRELPPPVGDEVPAPDVAYAFQASLTLRCRQPFVARPDPRGQGSSDWDERVAALQYRDACERAVGHGVATEVISEREVRTTWLPQAEVARVEPGRIDDVVLSMDLLAALGNGEEARLALGALPDQYRAWIQRQTSEPPHAETCARLLENAERACQRIEDGIALLDQPQVLRAFRWTQEVMADAARQRAAIQQNVDPSRVEPPAWRPFQLAFLLLNLRGIVEPEHADRRVVDLLFFPTGGGKTEAYLGLAAFTLLWRRLSHPGLAGCGMSVLMRYTLRLLTFDQLGRAAALICAMERLRPQHESLLGTWPFEVGLWVGRAATPNRMGQRGDSDPETARLKVERFQRGKGPSPVPLESCPWCGTRFRPNSFDLRPNAANPTDLRLLCANRRCPFSGRTPLPIVTVDEPIYRRLPCFVIATVDKLAQLPWVGESGKLLGQVDRHDGQGFYGPCEPGLGQPLPSGRLPPPDLIIQDELHLISGPLGTMVGLYESAVDALSTSEDGRVRPKVIASTATVRRAEQQVLALFDRDRVDLFPPPGPDRHDSFFARTVPTHEVPGRRYLGVAAQGRSVRVSFLRTMLALLGAGQRAWQAAGGARVDPNPADPYMTVLAYFNSLRELGGSRRIVEDEVSSRLYGYHARTRVGEAKGAFQRRQIGEPVELTSRENTSRVADTKRRLELSFHESDRVDVALATNMISVGLDIPRLGLMVVSGQPKMSAEYIQATSRVGRDPRRPGLVVTLLNPFRPRDRSHYETFGAWHESFYRSVEATSVTPFSPRALDRGVAGVAVTIGRHRFPELTPSTAAEQIRVQSAERREVILAGVEARARRISGEDAAHRVRQRLANVLDAWRRIARANHEEGVRLRYQKNETGVGPPLLRDPLTPEFDQLGPDERVFRVQRSMRDVEPSVNLWVRTLDGRDLPTEDPS